MSHRDLLLDQFLKAIYKKLNARLYSQIDALAKDKQRLAEGMERLSKEMEQLQRDNTWLRQTNTKLQETNAELQDAISGLTLQPPPVYTLMRANQIYVEAFRKVFEYLHGAGLL